MSTQIIGRIDEMGNRIDDLEKSISDLMQQVTNRLYYKYRKKAIIKVTINYYYYY